MIDCWEGGIRMNWHIEHYVSEKKNVHLKS